MENKLLLLDAKINNIKNYDLYEINTKRNEIALDFMEFGEILLLHTNNQYKFSGLIYLCKSYKINPSKDVEDKIINAGKICFQHGMNPVNTIMECIPHNPIALATFGDLLKQNNNLIEAVKYLSIALELTKKKDEKVNILINIAKCYYDMDAVELCCNTLYQVFKIDLNNCVALQLLGCCFAKVKDSKNSIKNFDKALKYSKEDDVNFKSACLLNKGLALGFSSSWDESRVCYERSLFYNPKNEFSLQNLLVDGLYQDKYNMTDIYNQHLKLNDLFEINEVEKFEKPKKVRKIGVVSGDLNGNHPVQSFTKVFDDSRVIILSNSIIDPKKFPNAKVVDISMKQDEQVYQIIKENEIDVLIDLSGNTNKNRMRLFSKKVCWRYISYLGYPIFCGLKTFDGYITDKFVETRTTNKLYKDKMMLMSKCFLNYNNSEEIELVYKKSENNVYGVMNRFSKMSKSYFKMMKLLLEKDSKAVLVFKCSEIRNKECVDKIYQYLGKDRIVIKQWTKSFKEHLEELMKVDVLLDTWSYSGTTTTCDSLFVGTPVITLESEDKNFQNVSKSLLMNSGLDEYVVSDVESYVDKAISVCENMNINVKENIRKSFKENIMNTEKYKEEFYSLICS